MHTDVYKCICIHKTIIFNTGHLGELVQRLRLKLIFQYVAAWSKTINTL